MRSNKVSYWIRNVQSFNWQTLDGPAKYAAVRMYPMQHQKGEWSPGPFENGPFFTTKADAREWIKTNGGVEHK